MPSPTANGQPLIAATIEMPQQGVWTADVVVDGDDPAALTGPVELDFDGYTFQGTARHASAFQGRVEARIAGGGGGLSTPLAAKSYRGVPLSVPLGDILGAAGETLSETADPDVTGLQLAAWSRLEGRASHALRQIVLKARTSWRILADGTLWLGAETWPILDLEHERLDEAQTEARASIATERPELRPGVTFLDRRVSYVCHRLTGSQLRSELYFEAFGNERQKGAIEAIVEQLIEPLRYHGLYPARVVSQSADGLLDLVPEDSSIPPVGAVPIRSGTPETPVKVPSGTWVLLGFAGGQPDRPFAALWESPGVTEISLAGGTAPVARVGDSVTTYFPASIPFSGLTGVPPATTPISGTLTIATPAYGTITSGAPKVKA